MPAHGRKFTCSDLHFPLVRDGDDGPYSTLAAHEVEVGENAPVPHVNPRCVPGYLADDYGEVQVVVALCSHFLPFWSLV